MIYDGIIVVSRFVGKYEWRYIELFMGSIERISIVVGGINSLKRGLLFYWFCGSGNGYSGFGLVIY